MIWLSVKREVFMQNSLIPLLENSTFKTVYFPGGLPLLLVLSAKQNYVLTHSMCLITIDV